MKSFTKIVTLLFLSLFIFSSCEKDFENNVIAKESLTKKISFKEFKNQTKMKDFETVFKLPIANSEMSRLNNLNDFVIDTSFINQHIYANNKSTYTFQVYPSIAKPLSNENYNLVYRKVNNNWEKTLVHFTEQKVGLRTQINNLETVYGSRQTAFCFTPTISFHCTQTGDCTDTVCDGCDLCVSTSESTIVCPSVGGGGPSDPGTNPSGPPVGGTGYHPADPFSFVPNIYENPIYNDTNYVNTIKAHHFWNNLSAAEKSWVDANTDIYLLLISYQIQNNWSPESQLFANEILITSIKLNINAAEVWNKIPEYRDKMSISEKAIFDDMLPNRKLWYLVSGQKASDKAEQLFPDSLYNGNGDAYRHALWNAYSSLLIGSDLTAQLTTAHENRDAPADYMYNHKETEMDLYNNNKGRQQAIISNLSNIADDILQYLNNGNLRKLNNLNQSTVPRFANRATIASVLIPTNL